MTLPSRPILRRLGAGALAAAVLAALALFFPMRMALAMLASHDGFTHCTPDRRILCEPGSQRIADEIARHLDAAVATIGQRQFGGFARPIVIYTYATHASFTRHTGMARPRAAVFNGAMHVSPVVLAFPDGAGPTLTHEMSHLQFSLGLGGWTWSAMPQWFSEGLATHIAGAGAEGATTYGATWAMANGKCMEPSGQAARLFVRHRTPPSMQLDMFYRQGAMFVAFLESRDARAFERMLRAVGAGSTVGAAIEQAYGTPLPALWQQHLEQLRTSFNAVPGNQAAALCG